MHCTVVVFYCTFIVLLPCSVVSSYAHLYETMCETALKVHLFDTFHIQPSLNAV